MKNFWSPCKRKRLGKRESTREGEKEREEEERVRESEGEIGWDERGVREEKWKGREREWE